MFTVTLRAFPAPQLHRLERVVQKHGAGKLDHLQRNALLHDVAAGRPQVVARYAEEHAAANAALEFKYHGATVDVAGDAAA